MTQKTKFLNFRTPFHFRSSLAILVIPALMAVGCAKKQKTDDMTPSTDLSEVSLGDSDSGRAMGLVTIHFPYDAFVLDSTAKESLKNNATILKDKASVKIQIEGHCDTRGGVQYNIALGEKRANAVKKHLQSLGISESRMTTISYGKEHLLDSNDTEEAHAKNRRANFLITSH